MIDQENGRYIVRSETGKRLSKPYRTKAEANKRLKQIEYFKNKEKDTRR